MFRLIRGFMKRTAVSMAVLLSLAFLGLPVSADMQTMKNSDTQMESDESGGRVFTEKPADGMILAAENQRLELYYNPMTLAIQVKEKENGIIHSSIVEEGDEIEGMNDTWRGMMQSGVTLELMDDKGNMKTWPLSTKDASVQVSEQENGFQAQVAWPEGVGLTLEVELTENGLRASVPEEGIRESEDSAYTLQSIYLFPFLDASRGTGQNGYLFVPDGCGALIRTSMKTLSSEPYEKQIYGTDIGIGNFNGRSAQGMLLDAENIYVPVYGIIQNVGESGVAAIIEDGDVYADIVAYASGITTDFNFITAKFLVRQTYQMKINQSGGTISANQEERNHFDIAVSYTVLSGEDADYIGIAGCYREYLLAKGVLKKEEAADGDIPLKLEFIVSEQKDGLVGTSTVPMTSVDELDEILEDFLAEGISNIQVILRGVSKEGATGVAPTSFDFENSTGTKKEWKALAEKYQEKGISIAFYCDFTRGYDGAGGYANKDRAQGISKSLLQTFDNGLFTYLAPEFTADALIDYAESVQSVSVDHLAVDCLGKYLYSNWNKKQLSSRAEAKQTLETIDTGKVSLALYTPNAYLFDMADAAYDMPTASSGYYIFTDTVPFLQIVLKGYLPMYGTGFNFHADADTDILRCIEYGLYPSYYLTKQGTIELLDTWSSWLYTSEYELWKESILSEYARMNEALRTVEGASITDRTVLAEDVVRVDYSNGNSIIVNYRDTAYQSGKIQVEANGYLLTEGGD